jgi:hypothetical protein
MPAGMHETPRSNFYSKLVLARVRDVYWRTNLKPRRPDLWKRELFLIGTAALAFCSTAPAAVSGGFVPANTDDSSNPYSVIVDRNIFHLNPPPPPPEPEKPKVELPVIKITGFVSIGAQNRVLFSGTSKEKKETSYYSLTEGEKSSDGKLELVKIHPGKDAVEVLNDGVLVTLTLKDNSAQPSTDAPRVPAQVAGAVPTSGPAGRPMFPVRPGVPGLPTPPGFAYPMRPHRVPQN